EAYPDAGGRDERATVDNDRRRQRLRDAARGLAHLVGVANGFENDDELIAAHTNHHVLVAHGRAYPLRHGFEQLVASLVAARVIDMFEAVEIEEEDGQHRARALGFVDGAREVRREIEAIRKARELVVVSEMIEVLLLFQELRLG